MKAMFAGIVLAIPLSASLLYWRRGNSQSNDAKRPKLAHVIPEPPEAPKGEARPGEKVPVDPLSSPPEENQGKGGDPDRITTPTINPSITVDQRIPDDERQDLVRLLRNPRSDPSQARDAISRLHGHLWTHDLWDSEFIGALRAAAETHRSDEVRLDAAERLRSRPEAEIFDVTMRVYSDAEIDLDGRIRAVDWAVAAVTQYQSNVLKIVEAANIDKRAELLAIMPGEFARRREALAGLVKSMLDQLPADENDGTADERKRLSALLPKLN